MKSKEIAISLLAVWITMISCNLPLASTTPTPTVTETPGAGTPSPKPVETTVLPATIQPPTSTIAPPPTACTPQVKTNSPVNVRSGPGTVYPIVNALAQSATASVSGKNADGSWWYVSFSGGNGWVSASVVTATCIPSGLTVLVAPPTPLPPAGTCKDGFEYRLINTSDKVCVPTSSKNQAASDNAAAVSRTIVGVNGAGACVEGYVWREAYSGDKTCVLPADKAQAAADNATAATRWVVGDFGPHTCVVGFVWREAQSGDDVCVTPEVHTQTLADNAAASSRIASSDACISGFVWREAFSGDRVCVTPAVKFTGGCR